MTLRTRTHAASARRWKRWLPAAAWISLLLLIPTAAIAAVGTFSSTSSTPALQARNTGSGNAVKATSAANNTGVFIGTGTSGAWSALQGFQKSSSAGAKGVFGYATADVATATYGIYGRSDSRKGIGVFGTAPASGGSPIGVSGVAVNSAGGIGVKGAGDLYGVYGNSGTLGNGSYGIYSATDLGLGSGASLVCSACIGSSDIATGAITSALIADGAVAVGDLAFDPATQAEFDAFKTALAATGTINTASNPVHWSQLKGVPTDFADGVDNTGGGGGGAASDLACASCVDSSEIAVDTLVAADLATGSVDTAEILNGAIVNVDIGAAAAIALSKLASGTDAQIIVGNATGVPTYVAMSGDVTIANTGATTIAADAVGSAEVAANSLAAADLATGSVDTAEILDGAIVNADIGAAAAIALSKLASGTDAQIIVGNATGVPTYVAMSGDVTIANTGATTIAANSVALTTDTTGDYVASVASGTGISGGAAGSEGAALTISVDQGFTPTWTGAHIFNNNVTVGDAGADTLTVNAESVFASTGNVSFAAQTVTAGAATATLTLTPTSSYVLLQCNRTAADTAITLDEAGARNGQLLVVVIDGTTNNAGTCSFADSAGVQQVGTTTAFDDFDSKTFIYDSTNVTTQWVQIAESNN